MTGQPRGGRYARLVGSLWRSHKVGQISLGALGAWSLSLSYSADNGTDGFVPDRIVPVLAPPDVVAELLAAGWWERADGGVLAHDYLDWNPSQAYLCARKTSAQKAAQSRWDNAKRTATRNADCSAETDATRNADRNAIPYPISHIPDQTQIMSDRPPAKPSSVGPVFRHWVDRCWTGKGKKPLLNAKRRERIRARLAEGYSADDLIAAIDGALLDPWLTGDNPRGRTYLGLDTILKHGEQVERLRALSAGDSASDAPETEIQREARRWLEEHGKASDEF